MSHWREVATFVEQRLADSDDAGTTRQISQREKISKLKNLCLHFPTFSGAFKADYLKLISAAIEDWIVITDHIDVFDYDAHLKINKKIEGGFKQT